jgi:hypothetical protein
MLWHLQSYHLVVRPRLYDSWLRSIRFYSGCPCVIEITICFTMLEWNSLSSLPDAQIITKYACLDFHHLFNHAFLLFDTWSNSKIFLLYVGNNSNNLALTDITGTTGWELALVTTPSNHTRQASDQNMVCFTTSSLAII